MSQRERRLSVPLAVLVDCTQPGPKGRTETLRRVGPWFTGVGLCLLTVIAAFDLQAQVGICSETRRPATGVSGMRDEFGGSLLVDYFTAFLQDQDVETFKSRVTARYNEGTLGRILSSSHVVPARRAAVLSLGLLGTFEASNSILGRALADSDPIARAMAEDALWAVWFRADTPANNEMLDHVRVLIGRQQLKEAEALATRLIAIAPHFAEAYNQRAFAYFLEGRLVESAADCQQVLTRNPFHIGAIEGLAKCQLGLDRPHDALKSMRRALKLRPHNDSLREMVKSLETSIESDGSK
jgi:tetratricopeptide (TPR) repeat protein